MFSRRRSPPIWRPSFRWSNDPPAHFAETQGPIRPQHYAFLISEADFDTVFGRIKDRGLDYWADPRGGRPGEINHNDGGRGVYFRDPDGHYLEMITRPYGGGRDEPRPSPPPEQLGWEQICKTACHFAYRDGRLGSGH